jgi:predicted Zn-dependent protease with MMP-like domain
MNGLEAEIDQALERFEQLLSNDDEGALAFIDSLHEPLAGHPDVRLARAEALRRVQGPNAARRVLEALIVDFPDDADAHYALGLIYEELDDEPSKVRQFLEVLRLDAVADAASGFDFRAHEEVILGAAERALAELPSPFAEKLESVPVLLESRPSEHLVGEGFDPRALGLFEGPSAADMTSSEAFPAPTRIVLYTQSLLSATHDESELREEVETTVLHELGHFFGMEEDDLERIGLD